MSFDHDNEFQVPIEKAQFERPNSRLAVTSLVFGILGVTALPLLGSIIAVATGHAALGEIRESGGRLNGKALAKVGLGLGYFEIILGLIALVILALIFMVFAPSAVQQVYQQAESPASSEYGRGVKMVNQMERKDFELIESSEVGVNEGQIVAYYNAGKPHSNPEFALLTTEKIIYLNDGRKTEFDLKDVSNIKDDKSFEQTYNVEHFPNGNSTSNFDFDIYHIEVRTKQGIRMRIDIQPNRDGSLFFDALKSALQNAGSTVTPETGS